jgi:hypothetical protein
MMQAMSGENLVVRLHITPGATPRAEAHAFGYWYDDMMPNGFKAVYRYNELIEKGVRETGIRPLECIALPSNVNTWHEYFECESQYWPEPWHMPEPVVCSIGTKRKDTRRLPVAHPQALAHLARFQGQASSEKGGIVNSAVKNWRQLVDQS